MKKKVRKSTKGNSRVTTVENFDYSIMELPAALLGDSITPKLSRT